MTGARFGYRTPRRRRGDDEPPAQESPPPQQPAGDGSRPRHVQSPAVGLASARFGPGTPRRHQPEHAVGDADHGASAGGTRPVPATAPEVGLASARFGRLGWRRPSDPSPEETQPPTDQDAESAPTDVPVESRRPAGAYDNWLDASRQDSATLVRPYAWTGGRTRGPTTLDVETLVSVSPQLPAKEHWAVEPPYRTMVELCRRPTSVAEVAALASLPLGVARVLLADWARVCVIRVHENTTATNGRPDLAVMERVLAGLRRL